MSSSPHVDNKKKTLVLGEEPTQGLEHTLTAEKIYSINFTASYFNSNLLLFKFTLMALIVIYLSMVLKFVNLKQKILKL